MKNNAFQDFTKIYPLSKTLRFEAKPVGATLTNIIANGLLEQDEHRAESYVKVKQLIDEYHKSFMERVLKDFRLPFDGKGANDSLYEYYTTYFTKSKSEVAKAQFVKIQENLRKRIAKALTSSPIYATIFKEELIKKDLMQFVEEAGDEQLHQLERAEALALIKEFANFTTYFTGFHENRANMYSPEEKSTAIAYRLINENLPRFVENMEVFAKVAAVPEIQEKLPELYDNFEAYLNVGSVEKVFELDYYNLLLTQTQIDVYNSIIGGKTEDGGHKKVQGLNELINLYNQQHKEARLPKLKVLYKQILSDRNAISWLPEEFKSDNETLQTIRECYKELNDYVLGEKGLKPLLESLNDYDPEGIFIRNDVQLTDISQKMFGNWNTIQNAIMEDIKRVAPAQKRKESDEDYQNRIAGIFKKADSFSIRYIDECLQRLNPDNVLTIEGYYATLGAVNTATEQKVNHFYRIFNAYTEIAQLLEVDYPKEKNLAQDKLFVQQIKDFMDAMKGLQHFVKPLLGKGDESGKDERFYGELTSLWMELDKVTVLYNMVRNYMTRKPYSQEKIKLNFENAQLLAGWDENKEKDNACIILRRNGSYYLAIMNKAYRNILSKKMPSEGECYEKMVYKLLPVVNQMLPKVFFAKSRVHKFNPSHRLLANYKKGTHKKGDNFNIDDCRELIDFFKSSIDKHEDWSKFGFRFSETSSYEDLSGFYREVEQQGYKITFSQVSVAFIHRLVEEGKMYLFQLYNKDFSEYSKGTPNMHTLYWKALFDERNLADVVYKLNGQAEMFYRKKSIDSQLPTHPAGCPISNKNSQNPKKESLFTYDLIKDRRYTVDKFQFHVPITMNFKSVGSDNINQQVREYLQSADDVHIIGIDRGERHLLYLTVIDKRGDIKEQYSLNDIVNVYQGNTYSTNYHDLLDARESERQEARQSWQTIENIKELKEGYLSQVIYKITQLIVKYHAIVVLEDLNMGFMRGRQKVEKQVYQKFEKMLIDKLNYLVDKKAVVDEPGGLMNAFQLTSKFSSFKDMGKQCGFLFYIPAWNTSKIDPLTGFVNLLDTRYESVDKSKAFFSKFTSIRYNVDKDWFEFGLDYNAFGNKAEGTRTKWVLCTNGDRILTFRNPEKNNQWDNMAITLTHEMKNLLNHYHIDIKGNLKEAISAQTDKAFFEGLLHILKLTLQMRNSITGTETDYLISPVADENGTFYDSRTCGNHLPQNADANGAFNIARKGLMMVEQIQQAKDLKKIKFDLSNKSWLKFAQEKPYRNA